MIDSFDLSEPLVCEGIVGDGCGGGRIFFIKYETLYAHDPLSKDNRELLKNIKKAQKISKRGCIITIECQEQKIEFDLSKVAPR
ncbi:thiamine biosynthesis protein ThiF [Sulfurimonas crateris]|uniref:Thiamine biosynthesis protein ThiF n=1 Tax=Sulfurimonas crateris TaxID=2574727 RepID=A0A4U2Z547_9BACT|nr:thiamine biosynthesis protein ThiF [Sulfurimonas crateris]TKI69289.1 thiamine biosynthesis protein ThiF [Sulfurimonas crateris]